MKKKVKTPKKPVIKITKIIPPNKDSVETTMNMNDKFYYKIDVHSRQNGYSFMVRSDEKISKAMSTQSVFQNEVLKLIHSKLHEIHTFGDRLFYFVGDFVDYYGHCFVAIIDTTSKQFREDAWVAVYDTDKCITLSFQGKVDTIILEDRNNIWRYEHLQSTMPTLSFHEKQHRPAGDWCMCR